jgi:hypothetical protein
VRQANSSELANATERIGNFPRGKVLKTLMEDWRRFRALSGSAKELVFAAAVALTTTWVGLRLLGFRRWKGLLVWLTPRAINEPNATDRRPVDSARAVAHMEQVVARRLFFKTNCLEQSLALWWLLRRRGIAAEVRIGARKNEGRFEAHAWVDFGGVVLNDSAESHVSFLPFDGSITSMETQTP